MVSPARHWSEGQKNFQPLCCNACLWRCVACLSEDKCIAVLPCRHVPICEKCYIRAWSRGTNNIAATNDDMVVWPTLHGHRDRGVEMDLKQRFCSIRCFRVRTVSHASTSSSMVLPRLREGSVEPPGNICVYIHLLGIYNYKLTSHFFLLHFLGWHPYRPAYLPNFAKRSPTIIGAHYIPHSKILTGKKDRLLWIRQWCTSAANDHARKKSKVLPTLRKRGVAPPSRYMR